MKNLKLMGFLALLGASLMFIQCTTDPIVGPAGADGTNGIDGINGTNGVDGTNGTDGVDGVGTASCVACHSDSHRDPIEATYALSFHSKGETEGAVGYAGGRGSCSRCHSSEGFINYVTGMPAVNIDSPSAISCVTCHYKHGTFDFENDGYDYALRTFEPVQLITDGTVIDYGDKSNLCINCHQPRRTGPEADADGLFKLTSSHWGPHYGTQATLLEGIQGMEIAGSTTYSGKDGNGPHRTGIGEAKSSCVVCHMDETSDGTDGSHSWLTSGNACLTCHGSVPTAVTGLTEDLETLATLLENVVGWEYKYAVLRDGGGEPILDVDGDLQFLDINGDVTSSSSAYVIEEDGNGDPITVETHAIIHDGHPNTGYYGRGAYFTILEAEAAWNYLFIETDFSGGIHNPGYSRALIKNSVEALQ